MSYGRAPPVGEPVYRGAKGAFEPWRKQRRHRTARLRQRFRQLAVTLRRRARRKMVRVVLRFGLLVNRSNGVCDKVYIHDVEPMLRPERQNTALAEEDKCAHHIEL